MMLWLPVIGSFEVWDGIQTLSTTKALRVFKLVQQHSNLLPTWGLRSLMNNDELKPFPLPKITDIVEKKRTNEDIKTI